MSLRQQSDAQLLPKLVECFKQSQRTYGVRRLTDDLNDLGIDINHKHVARLKQENDIYPKQHKGFVVTTDSTHGKAVAKNVLNRAFTVDKPNAVWVSDITYIGTDAGWIYLATIIDLYSRMIIGWLLANHMRASLVCEAIENAEKNRDCLPQLFHSDRGSQYVSEDVEDKLKNVTISMSRKGNCWDNAVAESFLVR